MARGKGISGTGDNSRINGPTSNHLGVNRSIEKRSAHMDQKKILYVAPEVNKEEGENEVHGVEKEQEARNKHMDMIDKDDEEEHSPGFIFMCSGETKPECFRYRVFGLPLGQMSVVQNIKPGTKLFLFDVNLKLLYGVFKAASRGEHGLEPDAFGGRFPAQVRFSIVKESLPLAESVFRHAIEENYRGGRKFQQQLSSPQVKKLFALFRPVGGPPEPILGTPPRHFPPVKIYQKLQPPNDPYAPMAHHPAHHTPPPTVSGYIHSATQITNTNPYTRAASDVVSQEANVSKILHNIHLLVEERKREQKRELVQQFGCASDYFSHPSHASSQAYVPAASHNIAPSYATPPPVSYDPSSQAYAPAAPHNIAPSYATPPPGTYYDPSSQAYVPAAPHNIAPSYATPPPGTYYDPSSQAYVPAAPYNTVPFYATPPVSYDPSSQVYVHVASAPGPAYWAAVAREGPNQVYIDPRQNPE